MTEDGGRHVPEPLRRFLALFNEGRFWDSHEALEEAWRRNGSEFYHGLILFASAFVHVKRRNAHGVRAQLGKTERTLNDFRPAYLGIDVDAVLTEGTEWASLTKQAAPETWESRRRLPELRVRDELLRGDEPELLEEVARYED